MNILKSIWNLIIRIRDIGVPEDMPPEEAKHIRLTNIMVVILGFTFLLVTVDSLDIGYIPAVVANLLLTILSFVVLYLNRIRFYTIARVYFNIFINLGMLAGAVLILGKDTAGHMFFIASGFISVLIFPKKQSALMLSMILLSIVCFFSAQALYDIIEPLFVSPRSHDIANNFRSILLLGLILVFALASRLSTIQAEDRLKNAYEKINRMSEKLKVYLPHQFVDTLAEGDSQTLPDYRRKRLTIFFSDVQGFTKWTDKLEPEEVHTILNHYLSEMSDIAHKHGGTIDKFIGDCLMIFFGDPEFTDDKDHAVRCVKMALEMQEKMSELRKGWRKMAYDEPLNIRIGINTGWATVGNFGSNERLNYTALGSAVNLASRVESACAPDKVTVSHTTYLLVEDEIQCEPKGTIEAKGFSEPVRIYEVVSQSDS